MHPKNTRKASDKKTIYTAEEFNKDFKTKGQKIVKKGEDDEQLELCLWIQKQFPDCLFCSDIAGRYLPRTVRNTVYKMRSKEKGGQTTKFPDLLLYDHAGGFSGLALEIKKTGFELFNKDQSLSKDPHIQRQAATLQRYANLDWLACFGVGLDSCKIIVQSYLSGTKIQTDYEKGLCIFDR